MATKKTVHEKVIREVIEKPAKKKKKKKAKKRAPAKKKTVSSKVENALVENFISLQKVMVNLSVKFDNLTNQISKLLELFEISAKALAEKEFVTDKEKKDNKEVIDKMDEIIGQNKILARGLTLMHDRITEEGGVPIPASMQPMPAMQRPPLPMPKPLPSMRQQIPMKENSPIRKAENSDDTYQRSISSHNGPDKSI